MIGLENSSLILLREFAVEYCVAELQDMGIPDPTWVGLDPNVLWKAIVLKPSVTKFSEGNHQS